MAISAEVYSPNVNRFVKVSVDSLPEAIQTFIDAMDLLAGATAAPEGSQLVFWWDPEAREIPTQSWAKPGWILNRLTCVSTPLSGKV